MILSIILSVAIIISTLDFFIRKETINKYKHLRYINALAILLIFIDTFKDFSQLINKINFVLCCLYFIFLARNYFISKNKSNK